MKKFILIRFFQSLIALWIISVIVFALARISGDPIHLILPMEATQKDYQELSKQLGLDRPYHIQYVGFIANIIKGDLGKSIIKRRPVTELIMERLPVSIKLAGIAFVLSFLMGLPLGVIAAVNRGRAIDMVARFIAVIGHAMPSFWFGIVIIDIFALRLGLFPTSGIGGPEHYILPAFTIAISALAGITRLVRSSMLEQIDSDYITLARVKGVSEILVVWKHALRNALIPVVTYGGLLFAGLITSAVLVEVVFSWPGVGRLAYEAIIFRDYPVIQGTVLFGAALVLSVNLLVDILYTYIDPRIRYA